MPKDTEVLLFAVARFMSRCTGLTLEHVMEQASRIATEMDRRDLADGIWQQPHMARRIVAAGIAAGEVKCRGT